jgi:beta-lactam-binding protein with PASTA domain
MSLIKFVASKTFFKQLIFAIIGIVAFAFGMMKWLNVTTNHDQKIEVPNLEKMNLADVENKLEDLDLNFIVIDSASYNPSFPPKSVIDQSPEAGDFVKEHRKIYLTLNPSRYADVEIPNLFGRSKRQVTSQLLSIGFRVSSEEILVKDIAKDVVRGMQFNGKEIKQGDKIPKNSIITLMLGDGEGTDRYKSTTEASTNE